mgnify:CR=1 FL=1
MEIKIKASDTESVVACEEAILNKYVQAMAPHKKKFLRHSANLVMQLSWKNVVSGVCCSDRSDFVQGYTGFIICGLYDQEGCIIQSKDHDLYLDFAWMISSYAEGMICIEDEVDKDFYDTMKICEDYFMNPY